MAVITSAARHSLRGMARKRKNDAPVACSHRQSWLYPAAKPSRINSATADASGYLSSAENAAPSCEPAESLSNGRQAATPYAIAKVIPTKKPGEKMSKEWPE